MSRIGNRILTIPDAVTVTVLEDKVVVKGPKGELSTDLNRNITVTVEDNKVTVTRRNDGLKAIHGTINSLISNMMIGVTEGYSKGLEAIGVGYRFTVAGDKITVSAGKSHLDIVDIPSNLTVEIVSNTEIAIKGIDKCAVGEFAANIRKLRKPEPYKGKGIKYKDEHIVRKEGKKAA